MAGRGQSSETRFRDGTSALKAVVGAPTGVAVDSQGNVFAGGTDDVWKVDPAGRIFLVLTRDIEGFCSQEALASLKRGGEFDGIALDAQDNLYVLDPAKRRVLRVNRYGAQTVVADENTCCVGRRIASATRLSLYRSGGIAAGSDGSVYLAQNEQIIRISPDGTAVPVAGVGTEGFAGDGGLAAGAALHNPLGLAIAPNGDLYFADTANDRIRKVSGAVPRALDPARRIH